MKINNIYLGYDKKTRQNVRNTNEKAYRKLTRYALEEQ